MKLLFVHDHRFFVDGGQVFSNQFPYAVLNRYLSVFEGVTVVARRGGVHSTSNADLSVSSGDRVTFHFMPSVSSLHSFFFARSVVREEIEELVSRHDRVIVRLPSELGLIAARVCKRLGRSYAVELVGCSHDAMRFKGTIAARLYAPLQARATRAAVCRAGAVCYVTESYLQNRYPPGKNAITASISNVAIARVITRMAHTKEGLGVRRIRIGMIGSLGARYKGVHVAVDATAQLVTSGRDVELRVLGGGEKRSYVDQATKRGIRDRVIFDGTLPAGEAVHHWLDNLDIYTQPSLTEGLPRALIEAMSRGLPAVASKVGGIPELLDSAFLFPPNDPSALAAKLEAMIAYPHLWESAGYRNSLIADKYRIESLEFKRREFLNMVRKYCY